MTIHPYLRDPDTGEMIFRIEAFDPGKSRFVCLGFVKRIGDRFLASRTYAKTLQYDGKMFRSAEDAAKHLQATARRFFAMA